MRLGLLLGCALVLGTCAPPPSLLDEVQALGELRVVTRNSPTTYFLGPAGPEGPEYDLMRGFAAFLGVDLRLEVIDRFGDVIPAVESGAAHVAAAGLTVSADRAERVDFGPSYQNVNQYLVYKRGNGRPRQLEDIAGRRLEVLANTTHVDTLRQLQSREAGMVWAEHPHADISELLMAVANGDIDYTIADSSIFELYRNFVPELQVGFELANGDALAWAFPKRPDTSLRDQAQKYLDFIRDSGELDRIMDRYYGHTEDFDYVGTRRFMRDFDKKLPRYRDLFEQAASDFGMDWRLLAAIGYQESHWNPRAISPTGVRGIMMLTRLTASSMGIENRIDPANSIIGGAAYLSRMKSRFAKIDEPDRTWFALAAYNIGYGHVQDARQITRQHGQDPTLWVHVKETLPLLTQRNFYSKTKHGYARGWEPVRYVENVRTYYDILVWLSTRPVELPDEALPQGPAVPATIAEVGADDANAKL